MLLAILPFVFNAAAARPAEAIPSLGLSQRAAANPVFIPLEYPYDGYPKVRANVLLGSPAQVPISTVMDLGSSDFWVYGPNSSLYYGSPYLGVQGPCRLVPDPYYAPNKSSTAVGPQNKARGYAYGGNGKLLQSPYAYNDTIHFGDANSPAFQNQQVAIVNYTLIKVRADQCTGTDYDPSILGLSEYGNGTAGPSFRQGLLNDGLIESSTLSMWFDRAPEKANDTFHGTALFGAIPKDKYTGDLVPVKKLQPDFSVGYYVGTPVWSAGSVTNPNVTRVIKPYGSGAPQCLIDSGSGQDYLPIDEDDFLNATGLIKWQNFIAYNGSCESMPKDAFISLKFEGAKEGSSVEIKIPLRNYARGNTDWLKDPTKCGLSMQLDEPQGCTLASPFVSAAFLAFNDELGQIGMAQGGLSTGATKGTEGLGEVKAIAKGQGIF